MKISDEFKLNATQHELDFVDIDPLKDIPLFVDPYFLSNRDGDLAEEASDTIQQFFQFIITLINSGDADNLNKAREIFLHLGEPRETFLGLSSGKPDGKGVGKKDAAKIFKSISESKAVKTGLVKDLEDCRIFIPGIDKDKTSDMATNVIRGHLIQYTKDQCNLWGIPLKPSVPTGFFWNKIQRQWVNGFDEMLIVSGTHVLLVPKSIVSFTQKHTSSYYKQHFVLNFLQHEHLRMNSVLVKRKILKNGTEKRWVTKKSIVDYEPLMDKEYLSNFTQANYEVFRDFKTKLASRLTTTTDEELDAPELDDVIDHLIEQLKATPAGTTDATRYQRLVAGIMELLFHPQITAPKLEEPIDDGRKRIDIVFNNSADDGFFQQLHTTFNTPAQFIFVECKNYSSDIANAELDQLAGRFSLKRGKFGLLLCRSIGDMNLALARCSDTYKGDRGLIIPLVDEDLITLLKARKNGRQGAGENLLLTRYRKIAMK